MLKWLRGAKEENFNEIFMDVTEGLQIAYKERVYPVERGTNFHSLYGPPLSQADFAAKPMVRLNWF